MSLEGAIARINGKSLMHRMKELKGWTVTEGNRKAVLDYVEHKRHEGNQDKTISVDIIGIGSLLDNAPNLDQLTKADIQAFNRKVDALTLKGTTKMRYKHSVTLFLENAGYKELSEELYNMIDFSRPTKTRGEIPEPSEIQKMIDFCTNARDRAIIATLFESGFRIGELIACRVCDLVFQPEGYADLSIPQASISPAKDARTKTGPYQAVIDYSGPYLRAWLEEHPNRRKSNFSNSALFTDSVGSPLEYHGFSKTLKRAQERAGIQKRIHPHLLRHANATSLALKGWSAEEINLAQGRQQGSRIGQVYVHLVNSDVRKKKLREHGFLKDDEQAQKPLLDTKVCWKCGTNNPGCNIFCYIETCKAPLKGSERFQEMQKALDFWQATKKASQSGDYMMDMAERLRKLEEVVRLQAAIKGDLQPMLDEAKQKLTE